MNRNSSGKKTEGGLSRRQALGLVAAGAGAVLAVRRSTAGDAAPAPSREFAEATVGGSSTPAAVSGYPSVTVPGGFAFGLPVGLTFIGRRWQDAPVIGLAYAFEQASKVRRSPRFLPTAALEA